MNNVIYKILALTDAGLLSAATGAMVGCVVSSIILSPVIIGGAIGLIASALSTIYGVLAIYIINKLDERNKRVSVEVNSNAIIVIAILALTTGAILGSVANILFPGFMLEMTSLALAGAVIGLVSFATSTLVDKCIMEPIVEKQLSKSLV